MWRSGRKGTGEEREGTRKQRKGPGRLKATNRWCGLIQKLQGCQLPALWTERARGACPSAGNPGAQELLLRFCVIGARTVLRHQDLPSGFRELTAEGASLPRRLVRAGGT